MLLVNLRKYAAQKNVNPPNADQNQFNQTENDPSQTRKLRSGRRLQDQNPNTATQKKKNQSTTTMNKQGHPGSPLHETQPPHPRPAPDTQTVSNVAYQWKNLDNPFSYSGNTATILDQIKSFS